jgi:hypothetical protein
LPGRCGKEKAPISVDAFLVHSSIAFMQGKRGYLIAHQRIVLLFSAVMFWCGLSSAQTANDTQGKLMTQFGEFSPLGSHWTVRVSNADQGIHIIRQYDHGTSDTISKGWKAGNGWFVYVQNDERVWFYDGDQKLLLLREVGNVGGAVHGPCDFPCPVPDDVISRLTLAARKAIKSST